MGSHFRLSNMPPAGQVPLADLIQQAAGDLVAAHPAKVRCEFDIDPHIVVHEMPERVCELIHSLVRQALQEMEAGGELAITAWSDGRRVELEIADTGRPVAERPARLPMVAALVGAQMHWQDCPQGGAAVTVYLGHRTVRREAA